jgi:hypothetical protein
VFSPRPVYIQPSAWSCSSEAQQIVDNNLLLVLDCSSGTTRIRRHRANRRLDGSRSCSSLSSGFRRQRRLIDDGRERQQHAQGDKQRRRRLDGRGIARAQDCRCKTDYKERTIWLDSARCCLNVLSSDPDQSCCVGV